MRIKGHGSAEDGALLKAALLPLTRPEPADPTDPTDQQTGEIRETGEAGDACAPTRDPREYGAWLWDALALLARHGLDTDLAPDTHGTPARLLVTLDHQSLLDDLRAAGAGAGTGTGVGTGTGTGVGVTGDGTDLPAGVLRRLACDAELIPAVLGTRSEVLDVGRTRRLVTPALWAALVVRDRHCTFPACDRPPVMCQAHHLTHWLHGGQTRLDNLALLCGHHHRTIHHTPWQIRLNPDDRRPEFTPPDKPGAISEWTRYRPRM